MWPIFLILFLLLAFAVAFFAFAEDPPHESGDSSVPYEVASTKVFRQLDGLVSILAGDNALNDAEMRLDEIERNIDTLKCKNTRKAYRYWLPHFRDNIHRFRGYNRRRREYSEHQNKIDLL